MTLSFTRFFRFGIPDFLSEPWHAEFQALVTQIDRTLYEAFIAVNINLWLNSTAYLPGDLVLSPEDGRVWVCNVAHTSAVSPTLFSADRVAHPTFWSLLVGNGVNQIVNAGGTVTVLPDTEAVIINKSSPSVTPIQLPLMASYTLAELTITDFTGVGGDITITPGAGEKIHGLAPNAPWIVGSGGAGLGGSIRLRKVTGVGWAVSS